MMSPTDDDDDDEHDAGVPSSDSPVSIADAEGYGTGPEVDDLEKKRKASEEDTSTRDAKKADTTASPMKRRSNQPPEPPRDQMRPPQGGGHGKEKGGLENTQHFVNEFFRSPAPYQKELLQGLLTDPRAAPIIPASLYLPRRTQPDTRSVSTQTEGLTGEMSTQTEITIQPTSLRSNAARMTVEYYHQEVQLSDQSKCRPLEADAFDYLLPETSGGAPGMHRSLVDRRNGESFNLRNAAMRRL